MLQTVSALFSLVGLVSHVAGGVADNVILERKIRREIDDLRASRFGTLCLTLVVSSVLLPLGLLTLWSDSTSDGVGIFLFPVVLLSFVTLRSWIKNGRKIRALRKALGE